MTVTQAGGVWLRKAARVGRPAPGELVDLIARGYLEEIGGRLCADDIGQPESLFAGARVAVAGLNERLKVRGIPPLRDRLDGTVVADRAGGNRFGIAGAFRVHALHLAPAEGFAVQFAGAVLQADRHLAGAGGPEGVLHYLELGGLRFELRLDGVGVGGGRVAGQRGWGRERAAVIAVAEPLEVEIGRAS